jgi:uncharacterized membrane protein (DUF106 family)
VLQVKERELSDNLEMRVKEEEIKEVNKRIEHLGKKIGDFDVSNLERQRRKLMEEQENLIKDVNSSSSSFSFFFFIFSFFYLAAFDMCVAD